MSHLNRLNLLFAFEAWAKPCGYDLTTDGTAGNFINGETRSAWIGYETGHNERSRRNQQLYAEIKKSSRYACQAELCRINGYGYPFKVRIVHDGGGDYVVKGGVGGQYRLADVNLYVIDGDKKIRVR
ncbi:hypothetical protein [Pseudomonas sp. UBA6310]|uniref:hypothetical protein n=1 Tax=Pseudomonas sp. UBA6310 TaxID=1947327 RepID=UPI00257F1E6D|nr:hypothetical protein [Pseudomonas sp. UBA6310]